MKASCSTVKSYLGFQKCHVLTGHSGEYTGLSLARIHYPKLVAYSFLWDLLYSYLQIKIKIVPQQRLGVCSEGICGRLVDVQDVFLDDEPQLLPHVAFLELFWVSLIE